MDFAANVLDQLGQSCKCKTIFKVWLKEYNLCIDDDQLIKNTTGTLISEYLKLLNPF